MPQRVNKTEKRLEKFDASVYRNRHLYGPVGVVGLALGITTGTWWMGWAVWFLIPAGITLVCGMDSATSLPGRRERWFAAASWVGMTGWCVAVTWLGPRPWLLATLGIGMCLFMPPWIKHRRVSRGVNVDRKIEAWGDGTHVGLPGTKVRGTDAGKGWYSFKVSSNDAGRHTIANYKAQKNRIAARFSVRAKDISFTEGTHEGEVVVTVRDEERETVKVELTTTARSIIGEHRIGSTDAGEPITMALSIPDRGAQHGAIVGATGSGKSSLINTIAKNTVEAEDALLWVVDMSYGAKELREWAPACDFFAYKIEHFDAMIQVLKAFAEARGGDKGRLHVPSKRSPQIVVVVDEAASVYAPELLGEDAEIRDIIKAKRASAAREQRVAELLRLLRKYGASFIEATQFGDNAAFGGATAKQQLTAGYAAVFYSAKNTDGHIVIPAGSGIRCSEFPQTKPGTCALKGPTLTGVVQGRIDYVTDELRDETVAYWRDKQPEVEPKLIKAGGQLYANRNRTAPPVDDEDFGDVDEVVPAPVPVSPIVVPGDTRARLSPEESRALILDTLGSLGDAGPAEVVQVSGRSLTMVKVRLRELVASGHVEKLSGGKYRVVGGGQ